MSGAKSVLPGQDQRRDGGESLGWVGVKYAGGFESGKRR